MEIDDLTLLVSAEDQIRAALGDPGLDIHQCFQTRDLQVIRDCALENGRVKYTGHTPPPLVRFLLDIIVQGRPFIIATSLGLFRRGYSVDQVRYVRENQATLSPLELIEGLRRVDPQYVEKMAREGCVERYGRTLAPRPYMGAIVPMEPIASVKLHWIIVDDTFNAELESDLDAVFEIGCGTGEALVKLALSCGPDIPFFGGDIAPNSLVCLEELARAAGLENVHSVPFDLFRPDFSFLTSYRRVLVLSHAAVMYAGDGARPMWDRLFSTVSVVKACLFEPVSYAVPGVTEPLFSRKQALRYGLDLTIFPELLRRASEGQITIDEIVPDISGLNILSPLTLIRFHTPS